ncbi:MAG: TlpA family protein disulfide reductase [Chloroflexi bacterium]|nr:TlpA family protein disulfide reductase [Chloroflexota bacterium]
MKNKPIILAGLFIAAAAGVLALTAARKPFTSPNEATMTSASSTPSPAWELKGVDGKPLKSSDFAGKVVILDFWATWCGPCRMEIPSFIELQNQYADKGLVVIGVSLDQDGATAVKPFMEKMGINYPIMLGDETIVSAFGGIEGIPTTFINDREGRIVRKHEGFASKAEFEADIKPLL